MPSSCPDFMNTLSICEELNLALYCHCTEAVLSNTPTQRERFKVEGVSSPVHTYFIIFHLK